MIIISILSKNLPKYGGFREINLEFLEKNFRKKIFHKRQKLRGCTPCHEATVSKQKTKEVSAQFLNKPVVDVARDVPSTSLEKKLQCIKAIKPFKSCSHRVLIS